MLFALALHALAQIVALVAPRFKLPKAFDLTFAQPTEIYVAAPTQPAPVVVFGFEFKPGLRVHLKKVPFLMGFGLLDLDVEASLTLIRFSIKVEITLKIVKKVVDMLLECTYPHACTHARSAAAESWARASVCR